VANKKISELSPMGLADLDRQNDVLPIVDSDEDLTKKISVSDLAQVLYTDVYDIGIFIPNSIPPNRLIARHILVRPVSFPANMAGSVARADTPPELQAILPIRVNGEQVGSITFGANQTTGLIACIAMSLPTGTTLDIGGPQYLDMKFSDLCLTLKGVRQ
jgi:hypothetical protein